VRFMTQALIRVSGNVQRAQRRRPGASVLALLQAVQQAGSAKPSDLADHLGLSRAAVTRQVQQLVGENALVITPDPGDRRSFSVAVTAAGQQRLAALDARGVERFALFTQHWTTEEVHELGRLLEKLEASIADAVRSDPPVTAAPWRRAATTHPTAPEPPGTASTSVTRQEDDDQTTRP
jgi:DNA-binding MarR family transcriptional regulator